MKNEIIEQIASNLTIAFYTAQEPRKGYLGLERRKKNILSEGERDMREDSLTPKEVFEVFEHFVKLLNSKG